MIRSSNFRKRAATVMVDFGVRGYSVRVGRISGRVWAHCDYSARELVFTPKLLRCDWVFANQIILHEVAHVLAGPRAGHGRAWLETARGMGYRLGAVVPYTDRVVREHAWVAICETRMHSAIRWERGAEDGVLGCGPCLESGAGDVGVLWERL